MRKFAYAYIFLVLVGCSEPSKQPYTPLNPAPETEKNKDVPIVDSVKVKISFWVATGKATPGIGHLTAEICEVEKRIELAKAEELSALYTPTCKITTYSLDDGISKLGADVECANATQAYNSNGILVWQFTSVPHTNIYPCLWSPPYVVQ